jgi:DNA-binding Lrp family transcriptional regulator
VRHRAVLNHRNIKPSIDDASGMEHSSIGNGGQGLGNSAIFLNVAPGHVEKAIKVLRSFPVVKKAYPVVGRYDIGALVDFHSADELRSFQAEVQAFDWLKSYRSYPGFESWQNGKGADGFAINGIVLIKTSEPTKDIKALQGMPEVEDILGTSGDADLLVWLGAKDASSLATTILQNIQLLPGIKATETLCALPKL